MRTLFSNTLTPSPALPQVIACFVFLNLVIAVILDHFTSLGNQNPDLVTAADITAFSEMWAQFDEDGTQQIAAVELPYLRCKAMGRGITIIIHDEVCMRVCV